MMLAARETALSTAETLTSNSAGKDVQKEKKPISDSEKNGNNDVKQMGEDSRHGTAESKVIL